MKHNWKWYAIQNGYIVEWNDGKYSFDNVYQIIQFITEEKTFMSAPTTNAKSIKIVVDESELENITYEDLEDIMDYLKVALKYWKKRENKQVFRKPALINSITQLTEDAPDLEVLTPIPNEVIA